MNGIDWDRLAFNAQQVDQLQQEFIANCKQIDEALLDVFRISGGLSFYDKECGGVIESRAREMRQALSALRDESRQFVRAVADMQFHMDKKQEVA